MNKTSALILILLVVFPSLVGCAAILVGAVLGAAVGNYLDQQVRHRAAVAAELDYTPTQGTVLKIRRAEVIPTPTKPGEMVQAKVEYDVITPNPDETVTLKEQRLILKDGQNYTKPVERELIKPQGGHVSTYSFTLPETAPEGRYTVLTVLEEVSGDQVKQRQFAQAELLVSTR